MDIVQRPLAEITPYPNNPRKNRDAVRIVATLIKTYGWRQPIVVDREGVIIAGHTRLMAAERLGLKTAPVHVAADLTPEEVRAWRIADNKSHEYSDWDEELLRGEIEGLLDCGFDLDLTGFDGPEINALLDEGRETDGGADEVLTPPENPVAAPGDIWQCGPHRIVCGDATDKAAVEALGFDGYLMVTDPPYGVEYDPASRVGIKRQVPSAKVRASKIAGDESDDWTGAILLFPGDVAYVWYASLIPTAQTALLEAGYDLRTQIIWRKQHYAVGRGSYHWQHETCLYAVRRGRKSYWCGDRKQSTVWDINTTLGYMRNAGGEDRSAHPTEKPVECMARPIRNHTKPGGKVYDPFLGSGTTLVAAQQLGRIGYGIEISPAYVDVACQRLEKHVGETARKVAEV